MSGNQYQERDFEHPSRLWILEDILKGLVGGNLLYGPYMRTFGLQGNERVLDFGCGSGIAAQCLANILNGNGYLMCVDVSRYWVGKARKRLRKYANVECAAGDIRTLDIPDSSFDVISSIHVIHDISPLARQEIVKALSQKLKAGGTFFIREPVKKSHGMPAGEIRSLFSAAGLTEIEHKETKSEYLGKYKKAG